MVESDACAVSTNALRDHPVWAVVREAYFVRSGKGAPVRKMRHTVVANAWGYHRNNVVGSGLTLPEAHALITLLGKEVDA